MFNAFYTYRGPLAALLAGLALLVAGPAQAGEFRFNAATNAIEMTGTIRSGDGGKFRSLLRAPAACSLLAAARRLTRPTFDSAARHRRRARGRRRAVRRCA